MSSLKTINWKAGFYVLIGISFALTHKLNAKPFDLSTSFSGKLGVGVGAALFWRGAWYALDDRLYPGEPLKSAVASFVMGASGLAASSLSFESIGKSVEKFPLPIKSATQFASVYSVALSNVLLWRGTWMLWDLAYEGCGLSEDEYKATDAGHAAAGSGRRLVTF